MSLPTKIELEIALKTYNWSQLWQGVKEVTAATLATTDEQRTEIQRALAFKALLLMDQWQLKDEALALLATLPETSPDYLFHFARIYTFLAMGDQDKVVHYTQFIPANAPDWVAHWLNLEFYGRSLKFKPQAKLLSQLLPKGGVLSDYMIVALLQTLDHDQANLYPLKKMLRQHNIVFDQTALSNALQRLMQQSDVMQPKDVNATVLHQIAQGFERDGALKHALKAYDQRAKMGGLNHRSLNAWMQWGLCSPWGWPHFEQRAKHAQQLAPSFLEIQGRIAARLMVYYWLNRDYDKAFACVQQFIDFKDLPSTEGNGIAQIFFTYTLKLCVVWQRQPQAYQPPNNVLPLHVIGESHCLSPSNRVIHIQDQCYQAKGRIIWGIKMFHLGLGQPEDPPMKYKVLFDHWIEQIPQDEALMLTIGEIDLRPGEGIWKNSYLKGKPVQTLLQATIDGYITHLSQVLKNRDALTIIQGIPAPAYSLDAKTCSHPAAFLDMIEAANCYLKEKTLNEGWYFLDVYQATVHEPTKASHGRYNLDSHHLAPRFYNDIERYLLNK